MKRVAQSLLAVAAVATLAACGNDRPPSPPGSRANPLVAKTQSQKAREPGSPAATAKPGYQQLLKRQQKAGPTTRFTPCNLVTRAQAGVILGGPIRPLLEAPQGPTCIYRAEKGKDLVTVAVQQVDFKKVKGQLRQPTRLKIASRTAICGQYGQPMLYARLSSGRVLAVAASCPVAKQFASRALTRLTD
jgi:predicted small lipoprotein YifL